MNIDIENKYITTGQAATMLQVNRLTIRRWIASNKLVGYRVGYTTIIPKIEVEKLLIKRSYERKYGRTQRIPTNSR